MADHHNQHKQATDTRPDMLRRDLNTTPPEQKQTGRVADGRVKLKAAEPTGNKPAQSDSSQSCHRVLCLIASTQNVDRVSLQRGDLGFMGIVVLSEKLRERCVLSLDGHNMKDSVVPFNEPEASWWPRGLRC